MRLNLCEAHLDVARLCRCRHVASRSRRLQDGHRRGNCADAGLHTRASYADALNRRASLLSVTYWEIIADRLKKAGWSLGYVSAVDSKGRTIWIVDAHRDGKRFIVHADEILTAFVELERQVLTVTFDLESIHGDAYSDE